MKPESLSEIVAEIRRLRADFPVFIAIEGHGGSGKSTFAAALSAALGNAYVVPIDDFIVKEKITDPPSEKGAFNRQRLEDQVLKPARNGEAISYQKLLWHTNTLSEPIVVPAVDYLIVEGISSYHPDIEHFYDYKIWIDTPIEVAREQGRARDAGTENARHWDLWAENDLNYQERFHPEAVADFVVTNVTDDRSGI